jgi:glucose-1-phosphate thymidylyltransferase
MKAIILAAGYGTRMYPLTLNKAKALLPLDEGVVLDAIVDKISPKLFSEIIIVTNEKFYKDFEEWKNKKKLNISLLNDKSTSPENALGWVKDLSLALENLDDDFLVISSDNVFGFNLKKMLGDFKNFGYKPLIATTRVESLEKAKKHGMVMLDGVKVISFEEKPQEPKSMTKSILCYMFPKNSIELIKNFASSQKKQHLIDFLVLNTEVNAFNFDEYCYDIGDIKGYEALSAVGLKNISALQ